MHSISSTQSTFDNNNDIKKSIEKMSDSSKSSYQAIKSTESLQSTKKSKKKTGVHLNNLWSIWYGVFFTGFQGYTAYRCLKRILGYSLLPWPEGLPYLELNCSLGLTGAALLLLPVFTYVSILKIGNLANDGYKLGRQMGTCSKEPPDLLKSGSCGLFRYGGPTAPFIHIAISFCLLIPNLLMEAKLIEEGFLSQDKIWHTDLDFIVMHRDRVVLNFKTSNASNIHPTPSLQKSLTLPPMVTTRPTAMPFISGPVVAHTVIKTLKDIIGHENHTLLENKEIETGFTSSVNIEYINLALALVIYSVRYPALFWATNKCLGLIFSFQLLINGIHVLLSFAGMSILYKVHVVGVWKALPLLKHNAKVYNFGNPTPFLLNSQVTFAMFILSTLLVLASSIVLYFYGHTRFNAFLNQQRESKIITLKEEGGSGGQLWGYFTHCAALCVLLSIGICNAPLIHDYTVVYRGSLDDVTLICIIGGIMHLFFWIVIWLFLTIKQKWTFKLRITIGRATVRESRSLRLVHDVHLNNHREDTIQQPLLVVGNGRTYSVTETSPKRAIMGVIQKAALIKKSKSNGSITTNDDADEQIYWLRPALVPSQNSPDGSNYFCWFKKKPKQKVTFNEPTITSGNRTKASVRRSTIPGMDEDDGDYATLRELPLPPLNSSQRISNGDDTASEEGKLLACVHDEHITYASTNQDFDPPASAYEDRSPLLDESSIIVHNNYENQIQTGPAPRCLRRADSGIIPHEEIPGRSDSISTESSHSPPDPPGSNNSETSSGIHSNDSEHHIVAPKQTMIKETDWKSDQVINITENPADGPENTVVIRRKSIRPHKVEIIAPAILEEDPYGRCTNMRMTSFTDKTIQQNCSATLPHYPTQPVQNIYPNCSTMPLPQHSASVQASVSNLVNGNSCNVYPRQHSTIPTHHNGVKLITNNINPYIKRLPTKIGEPLKYEPIYTAINRKSGELYHYTS